MIKRDNSIEPGQLIRLKKLDRSWLGSCVQDSVRRFAGVEARILKIIPSKAFGIIVQPIGRQGTLMIKREEVDIIIGG